MTSTLLSQRCLIELSGDPAEQEAFLQDLLTNDVSAAQADRMIYAALLTPQGKFLADMLVHRDHGGSFRLDVAADLADDLIKRLTMYKLRRPITLSKSESAIAALWDTEEPPSHALRDPRHPQLGWRVYGAAQSGGADYDLHRLSLGIPEAPSDLIPNDTYILEAGFEALNGVDFKKGCYVGQEIVARMKHKAELRKGYRLVSIEGAANSGDEIISANGKKAGRLLSIHGGTGLAHVTLAQLDHLPLKAGEAIITPHET